jgi:phage gp16-like protein
MSRTKLIAAVHAAAKSMGLDEETRRDRIAVITGGKRSAAECTDTELMQVVAALNGKSGHWRPKSTKPSVRRIFAIWGDMCRKKIPHTPTRDGLIAFIRNMTKNDHRPDGIADPEWLSVDEAGKVIEALKAWQERVEKKQ